MKRPVEDLVLNRIELEEKAKNLSGQQLFYYYLQLTGWRCVDIAHHRGVSLQSVTWAVREIYEKISS